MYIGTRKNMAAKFIYTQHIMDIWLEAERRPGSRVRETMVGAGRPAARNIAEGTGMGRHR